MPNEHPYILLYCSQCGHHFKAPVYCKNRFCNVCGRRRRRRIEHVLKTLCRQKPENKSGKLKMLTLTVPNTGHCRESVRDIIKSFKRLRATRFWKAGVYGGAYVIEITCPKGQYHVHIHALIDAEYLPVHTISKLWDTVSPGKIVWISQIKSDVAISYMLKYITKPDTSTVSLEHLNDALRDCRLFQTFGRWHGAVPRTDPPPYECSVCGNTCWLPEPWIDWNFRTAIRYPFRGLT
jgi:plasmid rolling circle replication initiator protein Rep